MDLEPIQAIEYPLGTDLGFGERKSDGLGLSQFGWTDLEKLKRVWVKRERSSEYKSHC